MQVLVVGAGVVGLAIARAAALRGHEVVVAEATGGIGNGVSSRNSEVVHAGIYYPTGSLRARHSTRGRRMLYEFCASHGVAHNKCGKLIVATNAEELAKVEALMAQGETNGVEGLELIGGNAARALETELFCIGALASPESGMSTAMATCWRCGANWKIAAARSRSRRLSSACHLSGRSGRCNSAAAMPAR